MAALVHYRQRPDAFDTIEDLAAPALPDAGRLIAKTIPNFIPVQAGIAKRTYRLDVSGVIEEGRHPSARVNVGSPFWHFLEYGTATNPPYRPIQTAVGALNLRYEAIR